MGEEKIKTIFSCGGGGHAQEPENEANPPLKLIVKILLV